MALAEFDPLVDDEVGVDEQRMEVIRPFRELNAAAGDRRIPWKDRYAIILKYFPSIEELDWNSALMDIDLLARILRDILKLDQAEPGRSGPRPALEYEEGARSLTRLMGEDYSLLPFDRAFKILAGARSVRSVANKTGLSRSKVDRLLRADVQPSFGDMEAVAEGFKKDPAYFIEYRVAYVTSVIAGHLTRSPEAAITIYHRATGRRS